MRDFTKMEKYYNIKYKNKPKTYGIVVKVRDNQLETITGEENAIKEYEISLDNEGNLKVGEKCFFNLIDKKKADELKENAEEWRRTQLYFANLDYSSPHLTGQNSEALY